MPCYHPIPAYQAGPGQAVVLHPPVGLSTFSLPCGSCLGCKTARALEWAHRCGHESRSWPVNVCVTLTYDDEHLPDNGHLDYRDLELFLKRMRQCVRRSDLPGNRRFGVRYFACGEYGEINARPHFHAILFNLGFRDGKPCGNDQFTSETLSKWWPNGRATYGKADGAAANYIAQYTMKKIGSSDCDSDGVVRPAPALRMSLKPGIGSRFVERFREDFSHGYMVVGDRKFRVPRFYKNYLRKYYGELFERLDFRAFMARSSMSHDAARLPDAELIHTQRKMMSEARRL